MQQQNQEMAFNDARYLVANKKDYYMALERLLLLKLDIILLLHVDRG